MTNTWEYAKAEHVIGKTISEAFIVGTQVELKFTDGSEVSFDLEYTGYSGAKIDATYYPAKEPTL